MHDPGPSATDRNTVMALMTGQSTQVLGWFAGSLRETGFAGRIILGVEHDLASQQRRFLESLNVTMIGVEKVPCIDSVQIKAESGKEEDKIQNQELANCGLGYEDLYFDTVRDPWLS